jgi:D-glycero-D-manno-heptose 1,7-bisphosphate phosphatase
MVKACFWDRDGVINKEMKRNDKWSAPWEMHEFHVIDRAITALYNTAGRGYLNIVITNQPDLDVDMSQAQFNQINGWMLDNMPVALICAGHARNTLYYKPGNSVVETLIKTYNIDRNESFFIGDLPTDVVCGNASRLNTIYVGDTDRLNRVGVVPTSIQPDAYNASAFILGWSGFNG